MQSVIARQFIAEAIQKNKKPCYAERSEVSKYYYILKKS